MTALTGPQPLPDYERPPLVETVLGLQFDRVPGLSTAHIAAFWTTLDSEQWPTVVDANLLAAQVERFDESSKWAQAVQLRALQQHPGCRVQMKNRDGDRMIQVQNGRFHVNWLGAGGGAYPRYESVRSEFADLWTRFFQFVSARCSIKLRPNQWEVTYVNHIPKGTVWTSPVDWSFFRPLGGVPNIEGIVEGESFDGEWHFVIPPQRGRLHVAWQHGREEAEEHESPNEFIRLTLTARGPTAPQDDSTAAVLSGLDLGRETIVRSFRALMSDAANQYWGIKNA